MAVAFAAIQLHGPAPALAADRWKIARAQGSASATVYSLNTLATNTRTIEYRAALVVSCQASRYPVWRQSVQIRRPISGQDTVPVVVRYDDGAAFDEVWALAGFNRSLNLDGEHALARLTRARRFYLNWRFGLFTSDGEAVFDVGGVGEAIADLARACGVSAPVGAAANTK
jgi:hypothetical protein